MHLLFQWPTFKNFIVKRASRGVILGRLKFSRRCVSQDEAHRKACDDSQTQSTIFKSIPGNYPWPEQRLGRYR